MTKNKIKILIADDHKIVRIGLSALCATARDMTVIGEAEDGDSAVSTAGKLHPDVIVMDLMMPGKDGAEATREILAKLPDAKVLILTSYTTSDLIAQALANGATGALLKTVDDEVFLNAIRAIASRKKFIQSEIATMLEEDPPIPPLTPRQSEVLHSLTRGLSNRDIATQLGMSETRVEQHVNALLTKIGAANRTEAVTIALRKQLLKI